MLDHLARGQIDDGNRVVAAVARVEPLPLFGQRHGDGPRADGDFARDGRFGRVDYGHGARLALRNVKRLAVGRQRQAGGFAGDGDVAHVLARRRVEHRHAAGRAVADVQRLTVRRDGDRQRRAERLGGRAIAAADAQEYGGGECQQNGPTVMSHAEGSSLAGTYAAGILPGYAKWRVLSSAQTQVCHGGFGRRNTRASCHTAETAVAHERLRVIRHPQPKAQIAIVEPHGDPRGKPGVEHSP